MSQPHPLRSVHTSNFPQILQQLCCSLVVTTYQAGRVIVVRYEESAAQPQGSVNTHFRPFDRPMGVCGDGPRLTIGGTNSVWDYRNVPGAAAKVEPVGKHDACYVPSSVHFTGDIDIHEMNWAADGQLWLVNTRFSCLCTLDGMHNFNPRWRPHFVSAYAPEDRCHLNGLALRDGHPRYVTALGETDSAGGWRVNKANGGLLMDVPSNEVLMRGLSMPHSPRWYRDQLWVLESGRGALVTVDTQRGTTNRVANLPGFTRGIDFVGPIAFIGLSKIREKAVFSGIPIATELTERVCGVWVVNIETGQTLAFLRFESGVEEIFAVHVLHGVRYPEMLMADAPLINTTYVLPDEALAQVALATPEQVAQSPQGAMARGMEALHKRDFAAAVRELHACLALQRDFPGAHYALGVALAEAGEVSEAAMHLELARDKEPDRPEYYVSLGSVYQRLGRLDEAQAAFETAIVRQGDHALAHESLGSLLIQRGEFVRGFQEYEWRLKTGHVHVLRASQPAWDGSAVSDKTLLVYAEHDDVRRVILLMRFLPQLAQRCRKLIVMCPESCIPLVATVPGVAEVRKSGDVRVAEFDTYVALESVPHYLGVTLETLTSHTAYLDADVLRKRAPRAIALSSMFATQRRIGLAAGAGSGLADPQRMLRVDETMIDTLADASATMDIAWYPLIDGVADATTMAALQRLTRNTAQPALRNLADQALLIAQLDAVIGVDTPAIHLAGALGIPARVILGTIADWCWPARGSATPWYPAVTCASGSTFNDHGLLAWLRC